MVKFDIGCSIGKWIDANYNEEDMFIGVEANPSVVERVREKFKDKTNVKILNYIVCEVGGEERDFRISQRTPDAEVSTASLRWVEQSRHRETTEWAPPIKVKTITMDALIKQFGLPSTVKIDVEGYEINVLLGLSKRAGDISFEWAGEVADIAIDCINRLADLGYDRFHVVGGDVYDYRPPQYTKKDDLIEFFKDQRNETGWGMVYAKRVGFETKIISLPSRPDRLKNAVGELSKIGISEYEWFPAFEGGALGCDKSHNACLKGEGGLLILEDDVVFEEGALEIMNKAASQLPHDWDILYLGANVKEPASRHSDNLFRVRSGVHTTHAMLYSPKGRQSMHDLYDPETGGGIGTIDHWLYMKGLGLMNCYVVWPMIAYQRADHSDIRNAYYDYKDEMMRHQIINMAPWSP